MLSRVRADNLTYPKRMTFAVHRLALSIGAEPGDRIVVMTDPLGLMLCRELPLRVAGALADPAFATLMTTEPSVWCGPDAIRWLCEQIERPHLLARPQLVRAP